MNSNDEKIIVFKNDAVGDLTQSLTAINNIINFHKDKIIEIYLSERSEKFSFLINSKNVIFKKLNYNLNIIEKFKIIFFLLKNKISNIYILTPKKFYFYLPLLFKNIKFFGLCINGPDNYKRPSLFLRKKLFRYVVNDRGANYKRDHTTKIQADLTNAEGFNQNNNIEIKVKVSDFLKKNLPDNYAYFHLKKNITDKLNWNINDLYKLFNFLLKNYEHVIFTRDIEINNKDDLLKEKFKTIDFSNKEILNKDLKTKIILYDKIEGEDLYETIVNSSKVIAFHGMMTNLASITKKKTIDMWFCDIKNYNDYRNYRNAFYEFKPKYNGYNFIIPSKQIDKTIKKISKFI
tara:strand:- start:1116 stop:2156 length:1041 start_codon:yes stop_codon:yes gene_type:complete